LVAEIGFRHLRDMGITIIAADSPTAFLHDTPTSTFIRQVLAAYSQLEKAMLVAKLRGRVSASAHGGRHGGQKSILKLGPMLSDWRAPCATPCLSFECASLPRS
jgi:DNA invertase Pin-like site-specific DNA recombinase